MEIIKYTKKWVNEVSQLIQPLFIEKQSAPTNQRCCVSLSPKELSILHVNKIENNIEFISSNYLHFDENTDFSFMLSNYCKKQSLFSIPTYWLLSPEDYQIFLVDSLPINKDEFTQALNWRIRSLINFPFEDAIIDFFKLPPKKGAIDNMFAAIVSKRNQLTNLIAVFKKSGLDLTTIDIPELAMRNLTNLYEADEKTTAFIYLFEHIAILNITRQKTLYFTRRINLFGENSVTIDYKQIGLDLLRYFDYLQSQWRLFPSRIFVASEKWDVADIAKKLAEYLSLTVEPFQIKNILGNKTKIQLAEKKSLLSLGCVLREDDAYVRATN